MEFSGDIYKFYSEIQTKVAFEKIKIFAESINYQFEYDHYNDAETLFCYKNKRMYGHFLRQGYNTDFDGQGCFNIEAKTIKMNVESIKNLAKTKLVNINKNDETCFYYILVIPKMADGNTFSTKILNAISEILLRDVTFSK